MDRINEEEYNEFIAERGGVLNDIQQFLQMILAYFEDMEEKRGFAPDNIVTAQNLQLLVKSLRLLHALYGYPEKNDTEGTLIRKNAVRDFVHTSRVVGNDDKGFEYYCQRVGYAEFWAFEFENGNFTLQSVLREPAYIFLGMVRDLFGNRAKARKISRQFLKSLRDDNGLKPVVWAECKTAPVVYYGVSLGVRHFVRPLYLHTKLRQLPNLENVPQVANRLQDVRAYTMKTNDTIKQPCITCQRYFGFISFPIIGNCAEYGVIGNVNPHLLETQQWQEFESSCQQHLNAFNVMMREIANGQLPVEVIMITYFANTRHPVRPKVLKYQWNPEANGGFQLIALDSST